MKPIPVLVIFALVLTITACSDPVAPTEGSIRFERNSEFDGRSLRLFVSLEDGTEASVNTTDDVIEDLPGTTPIPGHQAEAWTFLKVTESDTTVAHALLSWDPGDHEDYLVFGWWVRFPDQHPPELSFKESEQYAIVDGPELDPGVAPQLPVGGTATYAGQAGGLYTYEPGGARDGDEGAYVIDEYQGTITLTADFADGTLRGCIGCVGDLVTQRRHFGVFLGDELRDEEALARDYELHLATAIFREDGTFERDRVTVRHPDRTVTQSEGSWGGFFSNRQGDDGNPRLVAGFHGVEFQETDGSQGRFVGSFLGLSEAFRDTGVSRPSPGTTTD